MIRVLIIDDSAFMRKAISIMLEKDKDIEIIGFAHNGVDAIKMTRQLQPDVITLDIEMPRMNGLEALEIIMRDMPTPVLIVSSLTTEGAKVTLDALNKGAVDYIPKTQSFVALDIVNIKDDLIQKVKAAGAQKSKPFWRMAQKRNQAKLSEKSTTIPAESPTDLSRRSIQCIGVGVSTGGPPVLQSIITSLSPRFPVPMVIAQHMPPAFTRTFAERLDKLSRVRVKEAETGDILKAGWVYIARGGMHLVLERQDFKVQIRLTTEPNELLYHPSADVLLSSVAGSYGSHALGVMLTGMGRDGLQGARELKRVGGTLLSQNEATSAIYGMPRAVNEARLSDGIHSVQGLIDSLHTLEKNTFQPAGLSGN
ncbi:MAG: chemotaxis response regulator protein-glutamate methylesterase [Candidatus Marinimicrobia bacterium]|nr:chemotaxis response regulator protein-glutamate methylesterase [Candidatus Neomarinimicrobiota bacterium]MCF7841066.1 chemotaxis response regulator protein-glutamate methylesterase [Candidatus Neomarinimicrobiota bacterium]MCF7902297.1 chemotaxis response regulator protein-glutamate methylesterase [Candidatus Neomarinimicrobiota bacterium]